MTEACPHLNFAANVTVNRHTDTGSFTADVTVGCSDCDTPFTFLGLRAGVRNGAPTCSFDAREARLPIAALTSRSL